MNSTSLSDRIKEIHSKTTSESRKVSLKRIIAHKWYHLYHYARVFHSNKPTIKHENWIGELSKYLPSFREKKLWSISIPGTHHSALKHVGFFGSWWARCQMISITDQLKSGIRFFDLRICDDNNSDPGVIYISHYCPSKTPLRTVLVEIKKFLDDHNTELIILSIVKDKKRNLSELGRRKIKNQLIEIFQDTLIDKDNINNSIQNLLEKGKRVAITGNALPLDSSLEPCDRKSSWDETKSTSVGHLIRNLEEYLKRNPYREGLINVLEAITTGALRPIKSISDEINERVGQKLQNDWSRFDINVVLHDYTDDDIITETIALNYRS